jgi:flagellar basal body-associated protein FliL
MSKNKKILIIVFSLIIILIVLYGLYFFLWKNKNPIQQAQPEIQSTELTEVQRNAIVTELSSGENPKPITVTETDKIIKEVTAGSSDIKPLTDAERNSIINSLN